ncbi:hypothetical protein GCM10022204_26460 [Microlunatus aurantiacus]|uniref:MinD-like ATPase involved in chromosome partitioning or flagellar assembly n=1 Tax=Microlunatus aurantiacus TaxID=446786 RepID=A0ABP7DPH8_9ACTN
MNDQTMIPTWPKIEALTRPDGSGELTINGTSHPIDTNTTAAARREIIRRVIETAVKMNRPVRLTTTGPDGNWPIIVHPNGTIEPDESRPSTPAGPAPSRDADNHSSPDQPDQPAGSPRTPGQPAAVPAATPPETTPPAVATQPSASTYSTENLLQQLRPAAKTKAQTGWRSWFGLGPSKREQALQNDLADVRTVFPRAVTVMVANPKGGGGKTPTSLVIAGELGHARGSGIVVWDNNELRGNARDRSYSPHARSVADLLDAADRLEQPDSSFTELAYYLAHQTQGKYYVLSSDQSGRVVMDQDQVRRVHRLLSRFFEVIVIDTGNNEKAPNWLAARDLADCLVVPMKWRQDSILVANRMLATMAEEGNPLLQRTLLVGTNGPGDFQTDARRAVYDRFSPNHPITEIPTDPHLHAGSIIDRRQLQPRTQRAGLTAAAIVARLCRQAVGQ